MPAASSSEYAIARRNMVDSQLRPNRLTDPKLIYALAETPREVFVPKAKRGIAYVDEDIEIAPGRYLMEPMVFARLVQAAEIGPDDMVLDVACGTGYSPAILARLAATVVAIEADESLREQAAKTLDNLEIANVIVEEGSPLDGFAKQAPYDVILVEGAVAEVSPALLDQLADGGRLIAVVRDGPVGRARLYLRQNGVQSVREMFDAAMPLLVETKPEPSFVF